MRISQSQQFHVKKYFIFIFLLPVIQPDLPTLTSIQYGKPFFLLSVDLVFGLDLDFSLPSEFFLVVFLVSGDGIFRLTVLLISKSESESELVLVKYSDFVPLLEDFLRFSTSLRALSDNLDFFTGDFLLDDDGLCSFFRSSLVDFCFLDFSGNSDCESSSPEIKQN